MDCVMENDKLVSVHFDSIIDYMNTPPTKTNKDLYNSLKRRSSGRWFGPTSNGDYDETIRLGLVGDQKLMSSLENKISELQENLRVTDSKIKINEVFRKRTRGAQGDELDIHAVYQGRLDIAWSRTERIVQDSETKLVTLLIDNEDNSGVSAEDSIWRSACAVLLCRQLEAAGKSVRIITYGASEFAFKNDPRAQTVSITIKEYNTSLALSRLAAMSHIGFGRAAGFTAQCLTNIKTSPHLGRSVRFDKNLIPIHFHNQINSGFTKVLYVGKANNIYKARETLAQLTQELVS